MCWTKRNIVMERKKQEDSRDVKKNEQYSIEHGTSSPSRLWNSYDTLQAS